MRQFLRGFYSDPFYLTSFSRHHMALLALALTVLYPGFCLVLMHVDPHSHHDMPTRLVIAAVGLLALGMTRLERVSLAVIDAVLAFGCCALLAHSYYLAHINQLNFIYAIGILLEYCLITLALVSLQSAMLSLLVGLLGAASLLGQNYIVETTSYFALVVVAATVLFVVKQNIYRLTLDLLYANEVQSALRSLAESTMDARDLNEKLESSLQTVMGLSWCRVGLPIALIVKDEDTGDTIFARGVHGAPTDIKSLRQGPYDDIFIRAGERHLGSIFVGRREGFIGSKERSEMLRQIADSFFILIDTQMKNKRFEMQRTQIAHSAKMVSLGEMAGGVAHEINTPLATISVDTANLGMMKEMGLVDTEQFDNTIKKIEETVRRMAKIVSGLRSFARDGSRDDRVSASVDDLIEDTLNLCLEKFKNNGVNLIVPEKRQNPLFVRCQRVQVNQVLLNLLSNAFDAVEMLVEKDRRYVKIEVVESQKLVAIKVIDGGPGLAPEAVQKLFHPFFTTKELGKGTGLGLSISKGLLESQKGRLYFDFDRKETCFVMELPLSRAAARASA